MVGEGEGGGVVEESVSAVGPRLLPVPAESPGPAFATVASENVCHRLAPVQSPRLWFYSCVSPVQLLLPYDGTNEG